MVSAVMGQSADSVSNVITDTSMLTMLSFSREQEEDSDEEGIRVLHAYYGGVHGATELFDVLGQTDHEDSIGMPQLLSSHPDTENRKDHMRNIADSRGWGSGGKVKPIPARILEIIATDKQRTIKRSTTSEND